MDPTLLATGGILVAIFGLLALTDSDDDDRAEPEPEPEPQPELSEDGRTLTGTNRGDELDLDAYPYDLATILGGGGDDTITSEAALKIIYGEAGDDVIIIDSASGGLFDGGDGDDLIEIREMNPGNSIYGGEGDDTLNIGDRSIGNSNFIDAGMGDDIINLTAQKDFGPIDLGRATVLLGEGNDVLNVTLDLGISENASIDGPPGMDLIIVQDFNPTEDQLNIFVDQDNREFVDHVINEQGANTLITFNYLMQTDAGTEPASASILLQGVQGVQDGAINLIRGTPA